MHDGLSKTCDTYVEAFEHAQQNPIKSKGGVYLTGVDLGTAYIVLVVLDENKKLLRELTDMPVLFVTVWLLITWERFKSFVT